MAEKKRHLDVSRFNESEAFKSKSLGRSQPIPQRERQPHGSSLSQQYSTILQQHEIIRSEQRIPSITEETGIYVEIIGYPNIRLPLEKLDNTSFKLRSLTQNADIETAIVFIPESKRHIFTKKIEEYLTQDTRPNKKGETSPKNSPLIDSISEMKLASLKSFWTDELEEFPDDNHKEVWWELWLKKDANLGENSYIVTQLAERIGARLSRSKIEFHNTNVVLIKASVAQLERAPEIISNLEELRKPEETPSIFIGFPKSDQIDWSNDLIDRIEKPEDNSTSVAILDNGVNFNQPILSHVISQNECERWDNSWPYYDNNNQDHGSLQAGLVVFGDFIDTVLSTDKINISFDIESGRITPPTGQNDPELYGAITVDTASKLEINNPYTNRVFSMAITSDRKHYGGQPSSWSSEIDNFSSGYLDGLQRLFILSSGNKLHLDLNISLWENCHNSQIEDPAQSWNAISVGAYTEEVTISDPTYVGWQPISDRGDISPYNTSSIMWSWAKNAPFKPDIVAEGGNKLADSALTQETECDDVSLLTTSGSTSGAIFETNWGTSAATALVSNLAGKLSSEYEEFWPETIRGLIIHSAEWTEKMFENFGSLQRQHSSKRAKEVMLRTVGYGVPNYDKARYSANNILTLISENTLQPYTREGNKDPKLNEMQLYELPWPVEELRSLDPTLDIKLKVTLSYFIEPNPGKKGYRDRFNYQSHGLRFSVIRPGQPLDNFKASLNKLADYEGYAGPEGDSDGWFLGPQLRTRGSIHSDYWIGTPQELADMNAIAVHPVGGWWKYKAAENRWENSVRYSLIVTIEVPDEDVDIYSTIEQQIEVLTEITT